jgi:manganese/zinc/iron transport system substrate-binding protein
MMLRTCIAVFACFAVLLTGCDRPADAGADGKLRVVATVGMVADVVREVAGDRVQVVQLMDAGVDPHGYKPTRDDVVRLEGADVIFYSGLMLEGKMAETLKSMSGHKRVLAVAETLPKDRLLASDEQGKEYDPHAWMDASLWADTAPAIAKTLSEADPKNAAVYQQNASAFRERALQLYAWGKQVMATIPPERRVLVTSHDAFNYFGRAYEVEVLGVQGISTESEANVRDINHLVDLLVTRKVAAVFVESSVAPKNLQAVIEGAASRNHPVTIGGELFSDAMGPAGTYEGTYLGMIDHNITTVVKALGGKVDAKGWQGKLK